MIQQNPPAELEENETPEEYIKNRVAKINNENGHVYSQTNPNFPQLQKSKDVEKINILCGDIEVILPEVEILIKKIFPYIKSITEETKIVAVYLLLGKAYSNLQTALLVCRSGKNHEAIELSRSGKEALDLTMLFWDDKNKSLLDKWFKGGIIGNDKAREFQHECFNTVLLDISLEKQPIKEMLSNSYKIMSTYTHSGYAGLLDSINIFKLDFDFETQSGYHYCVDNFYVVKDLLVKILLNLKNSFVQLKDYSALAETEKLFKPFDNRLTPEEMEKVFSRYKK